MSTIAVLMGASLALIVVVVVAMGIVIVAGLSLYHSIRRLQKVPDSQIAHANIGTTVRLHGIISEDSEFLEAPMSGRPCVWYRVVVEERHERHNHYMKIIDEERFNDFTLSDTTGVCRVRMVKPSVVSHKETQSCSGRGDDASEREEAFLRRHNEKSTEYFIKNRELRFTEHILEKNKKINVVGRVSAESDAAGVLIIEPNPEMGLMLSGYIFG